MSFSTQLSTRMNRIEAQTYLGLNRALSGVAEQYQTDVEKFWPSKTRKVHTSATNTSVRAFILKRIKSKLDSYLLTNTAKKKKGGLYAGHTDQGDTQKGARTAKPFKRRKIRTTYTSRAFDKNTQKYVRLGQRILGATLRG